MIKFKNINFEYRSTCSKEKTNGVYDINLEIPKGQVLIICGKSGCGKTTLTRMINGLIPHFYQGNLNGEIYVEGQLVKDCSIESIARKVGSVFQNPRSQFFNVNTIDELAFGCENMGIESEDICNRINDVISSFRLEKLLDRSLFKLSGGEKQRIACGSIAALLPDIIVLDEPSSNLDISSIRELKEIILSWKAMGKTIIIAEHRLHYLMDVGDRVLYMEDGRISKDITLEDFKKIDSYELRKLGLRQSNCRNLKYMQKCEGGKCINVRNIKEKYNKRLVLDVKEFNFPKGAIVGLIGDNGAGKTTLVNHLCGLCKKSSGLMEIDGNVFKGKKRCDMFFTVMQDVNHQLFTESVKDEINLSKEKSISEDTIDTLLEELNLKDYYTSHPMSLSGGQKQRVAIACALVSKREFLVFDEPTSGLDYEHMRKVSNLLKKISLTGKSILIVSHDPELISDACSHICYLEKGKVMWSKESNECSQWLNDYFSIN